MFAPMALAVIGGLVFSTILSPVGHRQPRSTWAKP